MLNVRRLHVPIERVFQSGQKKRNPAVRSRQKIRQPITYRKIESKRMENTYHVNANQKNGMTTDLQVKKKTPNCSTQEDQFHNNKRFK